MDTKKHMLLISLVTVIISGFQCTNQTKLLENIPESEFIDNCPDVLYDFGEIITLGDPSNRFMISLPYQWDIRESYNDSIYGIYASNYLSIPIEVKERLALSVTGYQSEKDINEYYNDELLVLIREENINLIERGQTTLIGQSIPWVMFEMPKSVFNLVYYIKGNVNSDYYLIQTASYDSVNYRDKMCQLKQLVKSFELEK
ncbi:MAG: hypothetical protein K9H49_01130 [Bacteroidales bacterium]|nr:hypothetical protein [Bacteroidales bacterium]MCF8403800.1 hypothetical protein [Bacteroidales bacterium]